MGETVKISDFKKESRKRAIKEKVNKKLWDARCWFDRNKETVVAVTPIIIGGVASVTKFASKRINLRKQEELKEEYCYDRSLGHYWRLKRKLSNQEWVEIDRRKTENG